MMKNSPAQRTASEGGVQRAEGLPRADLREPAGAADEGEGAAEALPEPAGGEEHDRLHHRGDHPGGQARPGGALRDHRHEQQHHRGAPPGGQGVHRMPLQGQAFIGNDELTQPLPIALSSL